MAFFSRLSPRLHRHRCVALDHAPEQRQARAGRHFKVKLGVGARALVFSCRRQSRAIYIRHGYTPFVSMFCESIIFPRSPDKDGLLPLLGGEGNLGGVGRRQRPREYQRRLATLLDDVLGGDILDSRFCYGLDDLRPAISDKSVAGCTYGVENVHSAVENRQASCLAIALLIALEGELPFLCDTPCTPRAALASRGRYLVQQFQVSSVGIERATFRPESPAMPS